MKTNPTNPTAVNMMLTLLCLLAAGLSVESTQAQDKPAAHKPDEPDKTTTNISAGPSDPASLEFQGVTEQRLLDAAGQWGSLAGQVLFDGTPPPQEFHFRKGSLLKNRAVCGKQDMPDERLVIDPKSKGIAHCFIYLSRKPQVVHPLLTTPETKEVQHSTVNCRFEPHTMIIRVGQQVRAVNRDAIAHNTHIYPLVNQPSSIISAPKGTTPVLFAPKTREILPLQIRCDIHDWMSAYWLVTDHPYAAITDSRGSFGSAVSPPGSMNFGSGMNRQAT